MPRSFGLAELGVWHSLIIKLMRWISSEFFPHDSGNVTQLVHASDGSIVANYQYDPYGKTRVATGNGYQSINPFRYQTKFTDNDSGLIYYGYRYYSHGLGRFLNQDPIGEKGGLNLYAFVGNDPVNQREFLGLSIIREGGPDEYHWWREGLNVSSDGNSNWRKILTHAYNMYYNSWTAGQRNDFQVATLNAYLHKDTDRHDEASLDKAVGQAVHDAVARLMGVGNSNGSVPSESNTTGSSSGASADDDSVNIEPKKSGSSKMKMNRMDLSGNAAYSKPGDSSSSVGGDIYDLPPFTTVYDSSGWSRPIPYIAEPYTRIIDPYTDYGDYGITTSRALELSRKQAQQEKKCYTYNDDYQWQNDPVVPADQLDYIDKLANYHAAQLALKVQGNEWGMIIYSYTDLSGNTAYGTSSYIEGTHDSVRFDSLISSVDQQLSSQGIYSGSYVEAYVHAHTVGSNYMYGLLQEGLELQMLVKGMLIYP